MSIKDLAEKTSNVRARPVERDAAREPRSAPVRHYDATARMHAAEEKAADLERQLAEAKKGGDLRSLPLKDLHEKPGRRRVLTPVEYQELKDSVSQNGVLEPIKVTARPAGGWEVVSGNNKTAICRELGLEEVLCMVLDLEEIEADIQAFYANLFQTTLPDYESYLGFMVLKSHEPDLTQAEMARRSGKSKGTVSELMAFDDLPPEIHELLRKTPQLIGRRAAAQLASLCRNGHADKAIAAARAIAEGLGQGEAVSQAEEAATAKPVPAEQAQESQVQPGSEPKTTRAKPVAVPIKVGRTKYCSIRRAAKVLRIDFVSEAEAEQIEAEFTAFLKQRAEKVAAERSAQTRTDGEQSS